MADLPRAGFVQGVEIVAASDLPRAGFVQPVEFIGPQPGGGPPGTWALIDSGVEHLANATIAVLVSAYVPVIGEILMAVVSPDGDSQGTVFVHNASTNGPPASSDAVWCLRSAGGSTGIDLVVRSGTQGGGTLNWALYSLIP